MINENNNKIDEFKFYSPKNKIFYNKIILLKEKFPIMSFLENDNFLCFIYVYDFNKNILIEKFSPIKNENLIIPLMQNVKKIHLI